MKPLCCDGDAPQYAVRHHEGWERDDACRVAVAIVLGVPIGVLVWSLILLGFLWLVGDVP